MNFGIRSSSDHASEIWDLLNILGAYASHPPYPRAALGVGLLQLYCTCNILSTINRPGLRLA